MADAMLEQAKGELAAIDEQLDKVAAEFETDGLEFEEFKSLNGETPEEKNLHLMELKEQRVRAVDKVHLMEQVALQRDVIRGRREIERGEEAGIPPVEPEKSVFEGTAHFGRRDPMAALNAWRNDPEVAPIVAQLAAGNRGVELPATKRMIEMGPEYAQFWLPVGQWLNGRPRDRLSAFNVTTTPASPRDVAGQTPNTGEVEGTRPVIMRTTENDPFTSVVDMVTTIQVPTIQMQWWVEFDRAAPTAANLAVGENASAFNVELSGELVDVKVARYAVRHTNSRRALNNGIELQRIIMDRLPNLMRNGLDSEILNGDGTANRLQGILGWNAFHAHVPDMRNIDWAVTDTTATSIVATDGEIRELIKTIREGITSVMRYGGGRAMASATLVHFDVYDDLLNAADTTGQSLLTQNWATGVGPMIRGIPIVPTAHLGTADGTASAIVADWSTMLLLNNTSAEGGGLVISTENNDNVEKGLVTFVLDGEYGFIVENAQGVCTITKR